MIESIATVIVGGKVVSNERAVLDCGCACYVGYRFDTPKPEVASAGVPCSLEHKLLMRRHNLLVKESTVAPQHGRLAIEVVDELLATAAGMEDAA